MRRQIERTVKLLTEKGASNMIEMSYQQSGDYLIPSITTSVQETTPLGKYGRMRKTHLRGHRPVLYNRLVLNGSLNAHLAEIDQAAQTRIDEMMPQLAAASGVAEDLKAANPMRWVGLMNSLKAQAEEIILTELVFS